MPLPKIQAPRVAPPPLPSSRNLDQLNTGDPHRRGRLANLDGDVPAPVGEWVSKVSTRVLRSMFEPNPDLPDNRQSKTGKWHVEFLDGTYGYYPQTDVQTWVEFYNSGSWGQFIHYRCKLVGREFVKLRGPQRKVTARQRFIRDVTRNEGRPR